MVDHTPLQRLHIARGFTLIEAIVAMLLSSTVVILVATTFLVQNRYYSSQLQMSGAHDNARAATELMASEIRSVMGDGVRVAGARTLTIRTPMALTVVCDTGGGHATVHFTGGVSALDTAEVAGAATLDTLTGAWTYGNSDWSSLDRGGGNPASDCEDNGADTTSVSSNFYRLDKSQLNSTLGADPVSGDILMLFRETTFQFQTSVMDTTEVGLFRRAYGASLVEYATGMDTTAQFQYRTGGSTYSDTVVAGQLGAIDVVRIVADARKTAQVGGVEDLRFGWSVNVALRNIR